MRKSDQMFNGTSISATGTFIDDFSQVSPATQPEQTAAPTAEPRTKQAEAPPEGFDDRPLAIMRKPFAANQISKMCRSTKKDNQAGKCKDCGGWHKVPSFQLNYVGHAALTDRLLEADPTWTWEPMALAPNGTPLLDADGGMWIKLTVGGVTRLGYGDAQGKTGGDATKERIGDALRNAAMRFGAALELWHKGDLHVVAAEPEEEGKPNGTYGADKLDEQLQWIASANAKELRGIYETAYQMFASWPDAQKKIIEAKDIRKQEVA